MSKKTPKKNHGSSKPVKGSLEPFDLVFKKLKAVKLLTIEEFNKLRDMLKDAIGLRFQLIFPREIIEISDECLEIFRQFLEPYEFDFFRCTIRYYNNRKEHLNKLIETPSCNSGKREKSIQHARKDCLKFGKSYLSQLRNKFNGHYAEELDCQYKSIDKTVGHVTNYLYTILCKPLPCVLNEDCFNEINIIDNSLAKYYKYDEAKGIYKRTVKKGYKSISIEAGSLLYCLIKLK